MAARGLRCGMWNRRWPRTSKKVSSCMMLSVPAFAYAVVQIVVGPSTYSVPFDSLYDASCPVNTEYSSFSQQLFVNCGRGVLSTWGFKLEDGVWWVSR